MSHDSSSIKIEVYSNGKTHRLLKLLFFIYKCAGSLIPRPQPAFHCLQYGKVVEPLSFQFFIRARGEPGNKAKCAGILLTST